MIEGTRDICEIVARYFEEWLSTKRWLGAWKSLQIKTDFNDANALLLILGMMCAMALLDVDKG